MSRAGIPRGDVDPRGADLTRPQVTHETPREQHDAEQANDEADRQQ